MFVSNFFKRSPLKWNFLRFLSARLIFCQIPSANFEMRSRFLSKFCIPLPVSWKITPLYLFSSNNIYFAHNEPIKVTILGTLECSGQNLSYSLCQFWNEDSIPLQILYPSSSFMKDYSSVLFLVQTMYTLLKRKEHIKIKLFEIFECSCQILSNFLCQFRNEESIPLEILYPSSSFMKDYSSVLF